VPVNRKISPVKREDREQLVTFSKMHKGCVSQLRAEIGVGFQNTIDCGHIGFVETRQA